MNRFYVVYSERNTGNWPVADRNIKESANIICSAYSRKKAEKIRNALNFMDTKDRLFIEIYTLLCSLKLDAQKAVNNSDSICKRIFKL